MIPVLRRLPVKSVYLVMTLLVTNVFEFVRKALCSVMVLVKNALLLSLNVNSALQPLIVLLVVMATLSRVDTALLVLVFLLAGCALTPPPAFTVKGGFPPTTEPAILGSTVMSVIADGVNLATIAPASSARLALN